MIRGTTAQFKFKIPYDFIDLTAVRIVFWQEEYNGPDETRPLPIIKVLEQCWQGGSSRELVVTLNKEETLRFTDKRKAYVQIHAEARGIAFGNDPEMITVYPSHDDTILDDDVIPTPTPTPEGVIILDGAPIA